METAPLTTEEKAALKHIKNGADIFSPDLARQLRAIKQAHPTYLDICEPMGEYSVYAVHPFIGAILSAEGKRAIRKARK